MTQTHEAEHLIDVEFKDSNPLKTVDRIKQILEENQIKVNESWNESGVPYCFSMRLKVVGTNFGVNGKGLTKDFAKASAYGELMERLQFGYIGSLGAQKSASFSSRQVDNTTIPINEHLKTNYHIYEAIANRYNKYTNENISPESVLSRYIDERGDIRVNKYYNLTRKESTFFPVELHGVYTTNGAAAGNTTEEALVQAISETVERHNHLQILHEGLSLPDIPEDTLKQYKTAHNIITYIRQQGYRVVIKDASLGMKFPVVCAIFIQEKSGKYHTHFGAFPILEIAIERALTETFQGRNLENFAKFYDFHYDLKTAYSAEAILAELISGCSEKFVEFFSGTPKYSYNDKMGFSGVNNIELVAELVNYFRDIGYDILVRDRSCLGFPAFQVIIPGYSEWAIHRLNIERDDSAYMPNAIRVMRNPSAATDEDIEKYNKYFMLKNEYNSINTGKTSFCSLSLLSAKIPTILDDQLLYGTKAYVAYRIGDYKMAATYLNQIIKLNISRNSDRLICLKRYLMMKVNGYSIEQIEQTLTFFHLPQTRNWLQENTAEGKNPFDTFVLHCDEKCSYDCLLSSVCNQKQTRDLTEFILNKIRQIRFEDTVCKLERIIH